MTIQQNSVVGDLARLGELYISLLHTFKSKVEILPQIRQKHIARSDGLVSSVDSSLIMKTKRKPMIVGTLFGRDFCIVIILHFL